MTYFLRDVLRQPDELQRVIEYFSKTARPTLEKATKAIRNARHVYLTGIGSSWHAALSTKWLFHGGGFPVHALDAAELLHFATLLQDSVIIVPDLCGARIDSQFAGFQIYGLYGNRRTSDSV